MEDGTMTGMMTEDEFLEHLDARENMSEEEFLMHYGKKGMKWGQKMAEYNNGVFAQSRNARNASKTGVPTSAERSSAIDSARTRIKSGDNRAAFKSAKGDLKATRKAEGRWSAGAKAAKTALRAVRDKNADDAHDARLAKAGKEMVIAGLAAVASVAISMASAKR